MAHELARVEVGPVSPTIVSVDPVDHSIIAVTRNETKVELSTAGPKETEGTFASIEDVDIANKVDKSLVYYDENSDMFKADSLYTVITLTDGGNF